ncbi:MAG TPA: hypothetical protein VEB20_18605 [Azospirillaceae bacterium]|nr:hypothetical protein [Azospirillaceae bacterium]
MTLSRPMLFAAGAALLLPLAAVGTEEMLARSVAPEPEPALAWTVDPASGTLRLDAAGIAVPRRFGEFTLSAVHDRSDMGIEAVADYQGPGGTATFYFHRPEAGAQEGLADMPPGAWTALVEGPSGPWVVQLRLSIPAAGEDGLAAAADAALAAVSWPGRGLAALPPRQPQAARPRA